MLKDYVLWQGLRPELKSTTSGYFFLSLLIFLAISSTSFGFNSARTLSTMLAMAADSVVDWPEDSPAETSITCLSTFGTEGTSAAFSSAAAASAICAVISDPTIDSRICFQFCHAAASSASRCFAPSSISVALGATRVSGIDWGTVPLADA